MKFYTFEYMEVTGWGVPSLSHNHMWNPKGKSALMTLSSLAPHLCKCLWPQATVDIIGTIHTWVKFWQHTRIVMPCIHFPTCFYSNFSFCSLHSFIRKRNGRLMRSPCCLCASTPFNFWNKLSIFMKHSMNFMLLMLLEAFPTSYFLLPPPHFHSGKVKNSLCICSVHMSCLQPERLCCHLSVVLWTTHSAI
jgi:hypothetical protein